MDMNTLTKVLIGFSAIVAAVSMLLTSIVNGITSFKTLKILNNMIPKYDMLMDMCIDQIDPDNNKVNMED